MKKLVICVIGVSACITLYMLLAPSVAPMYWQSGARQMYEFSHSNDVSLASPSGDMTTGRQMVTGVLNMRVFEAGDDRVKIGIQISPVTVTSAGSRIPGLEKLISSFFLAELTPEGRFVRFYFDPGVSKEDGKTLISIVQSFQCVIIPGGSSEWNSVEEDGIGEYRSWYTAKRRYIVKKKQEYRRIKSTGFSPSWDSEITAVIGENSKLVVHREKSTSWIHSARGVDYIDYMLNDRRIAASSVSASIKLAEFDPDPDIGIWSHEGSFDDLAAFWQSGTRREGSFWKDMEIISLKKKYRGVNFRDLVKGFTVTGKTVPWDSISALRDYLLVNPGECARVAEYLLSGTLDGVQQAALIHVLELVGHEDAQKTLVNIINDQSQTPMNRVRSIIALSGVSMPSDESIEGLLAVCRSRGSDAGHELSDTAILGIGNVSRWLGGSAGDKDAERRRDRINEFLLNEFSSGSGDADKTAIVLAAIGNTRDGAFAKTIMPCINDGSARVRVSAVKAVVAVGDDKALESVVERLRVETHREVKTAIIDSLCGKTGMDSAVRFITGAIHDETDPAVRKSMLRYLVKNRDSYPGIKDTLQSMVQTESNPENRKLIFQGLYSKQKK